MTRSIIPPLDLARIRRFAEARVPPEQRDKVRLELEVGRSTVTIVEWRAPWRRGLSPAWSRSKIADLRYSEKHEGWTLHWIDQNGVWHRASKDPPVPHVGPLLEELERDPDARFWG